MTIDLTQAILDWRDTNATGPTVSYYATQEPSYQCKSDPFETLDELRMVYGADMDTLVGEDANRNGILDPNETDQNQNGLLDPGVIEYFTVYSREPNTNSTGAAKVLINPANVNPGGPLETLLRSSLSAARATQILNQFRPRGGGGGAGGTNQANSPAVPFASPLQFYTRSGMTSAEFGQICTNLTTVAAGRPYIEGRVNVNTASAAVLTCLLNGDAAAAQQMVSYRQNNPTSLDSIAWVIEALQNFPNDLQALESWDCLTTQSFQFTADIAALGPHGRGYRRVKFVFDTSSGTPQIVYRQDLTQLGWALGKDARQKALSGTGKGTG